MPTDAEKAANAKRLLEDPMLDDAFAAVMDAAIDEIKTSKPEQKELRETCYFKIQAIDAVQEDLKAHITQHQLNERQNRS